MDRKQLAKTPTKMAGDPATRAHAYKRIDRMTLMGLSLRKLIVLRDLPKPVTLRCQAASLQAGKGSRAFRTEAAHNLPRDLLVNGDSFWALAEKVDAHPRIKLQLYYSSAATMTVAKEANYLDSRWEQWGLPEDWLEYLRHCAAAGRGTGAGTLGAITKHAQTFQGVCQKRLEEVIERIRERAYFDRHEEAMETTFDLYQEALAGYDPGSRLDRMWQIYQLEKYR